MAARSLSRTWRRIVRTLLVTGVLLALLIVAAIPFAGRYLIVDIPLQKADALVMLAGGTTARWREAAELYREGYGRAVLLSPGYADPLGDDLRAQGFRFPTEAQIIRDVYVQLGVPSTSIDILPGGYDNTADEAAGARRVAAERGWRSLIVVSSPYHTRRALYAFQREFAGTGITIQVRGSRYEKPQPDGWWRSRSDLRWVLSEMQRLVAYRLGLGK